MVDIADTARDKDQEVFPRAKARNETCVLHRREQSDEHRNSDLSAVGVAAEHVIPVVEIEAYFRIRVVIEHESHRAVPLWGSGKRRRRSGPAAAILRITFPYSSKSP